MKNLMISTALLAIAGTSAVAQDTMFRTENDPMEVHASDFIGQRIYASEAEISGEAYDGAQDGWQDIGEVNDVILSRDGSVEAVLVDIGGFLGIGERQVAVDMDALKFVNDDATADDMSDYFLVMNADRATFEGAPEYSWNETTSDTTMGTASDSTPADTEMAATVNDEMTSDPIARDGYQVAEQDVLTTEMQTGAPAYDANDKWIGEVSELIINDQGKITHGIIDVGGFLGIGEKPVELAIGDVEILRETDGDDLRVYISMTKDELESLPTYEQ
jgi:hypothetical protein